MRKAKPDAACRSSAAYAILSERLFDGGTQCVTEMATKASKSGKPNKQTKRPATKAPSKAPAKKQGKQGAQGGGDWSAALLRPEVAGVGLVLIAVFTLLSLLTGSRGGVTEGWVGFLRSLFGAGVWGIPLVTGALGLWLIIRAIERMPNMSWQRPVGFGILFLTLTTAAALLIPSQQRLTAALAGDGGGQVGTALADGLQGLLGGWGAWAAVTFMVILGVVFLADRLLLDAWYWFSDWSSQGGGVQGARSAPPAAKPPAPPIKPPVPLPTGVVPWWKRFLASRSPQQASLPPYQPPVLPPASANLVRPDTPRETPRLPDDFMAKAGPPSSGVTPAAPLPPRAITQPSAEGDLLNPRIVGSLQEWRLPPLSTVLNDWERVSDSDELIRDQGRLIQETLALFGVPADFEGAYKGPSVTQYLIKPGYTDRKVGNEQQRVKVKVAKIAALSNDLALALAAPSVRIEAPIPGTNYVGVEVPNQTSNVVGLKELMETDTFVEMKGRMRIALGEDVKGTPVVSDLARMPHLLIAGATGSGKSVCINSIIACLLLTHTPDSLRLLMVDPKMVELSTYNGIPHLLSPVVTEVDKAAAVLFWAVREMERRYSLFSSAGARDLARYNAHLQKSGEKPLPMIVVIVDEMADLMMAAPEEVEKHICRLAQMARAVGIHLIIATQRPSVDVITGLIKANFPARIAFAVTSQIDSRVILDIPGAERLLGRGDMLFMAPDTSKLERIQGTFLSDDEITKLVRYWRGIRTYETSQMRVEDEGAADAPPSLDTSNFAVKRGPEPSTPTTSLPPAAGLPSGPLNQPPLFEQIEQLRAADARDKLYDEALRIFQEHGTVSINLLQRRLRVGYGRAARLVEQLREAGALEAARIAPEPKAPPQDRGPAPSQPSQQPRIIGGTSDAGAVERGKGSDENINPPSHFWM
jgi:S-DNA-T family DNA segregation ATPase FtsK/SpoIIIE